jgi:hypothetical protein
VAQARSAEQHPGCGALSSSIIMTKNQTNLAVNDTLPRLLGGLVGASIGIALYASALSLRHLDILVVVGVALSLGVARGSSRRSVAWAAGTAFAAAAVSLLVLAWFRPFPADASLGYFFSNLGELGQRNWLILAASTATGAWFGYGRPRRRRSPGRPQSAS